MEALSGDNNSDNNYYYSDIKLRERLWKCLDSAPGPASSSLRCSAPKKIFSKHG